MHKKLTKKEAARVRRLISLFPSEILIKISHAEEGGFCGEIFLGEDKLLTQGETTSEFIGMVNDVIRTYFEIPLKFISYMPEYLPPLESMQQLGLMPQFTTTIPRLEPVQS